MANREAGAQAVALIKAIEDRNAANLADAKALIALDRDENFAGVDPRDRRALAREARQLKRVMVRTEAEARDVHEAMDVVISGSDVLVPMFGK